MSNIYFTTESPAFAKASVFAKAMARQDGVAGYRQNLGTLIF